MRRHSRDWDEADVGRQGEVHGGAVEHGQQPHQPRVPRSGDRKSSMTGIGGVALGQIGGPASHEA